MCLSTIPAAEALLTFVGLESPLSIDHWHLPTALGAAWARRVTHLGQGHMSFAMCCLFFACTLLEGADCLQGRIAPCRAVAETSCREVRCRKASFAVILSSTHGIWPAVASGLLWTRAKARAHDGHQ